MSWTNQRFGPRQRPAHEPFSRIPSHAAVGAAVDDRAAQPDADGRGGYLDGRAFGGGGFGGADFCELAVSRAFRVWNRPVDRDFRFHFEFARGG